MKTSGKAMQALLSNGTAPDDEATLKLMQDMHPTRTTPLRPHASTVPKVHVSVNEVKRVLYRATSKDRTCIDVFGWAVDFLFHVRATPFLRQVARLIARLANAEVPDCFGTILTCGTLIALHKEDLKTQEITRQKGLPPKLRPVNIGCCFLKLAFQCALSTKPAKTAAAQLAFDN